MTSRPWPGRSRAPWPPRKAAICSPAHREPAAKERPMVHTSRRFVMLPLLLSLATLAAQAEEPALPGGGLEEPGAIRVLLAAGLETTLSSQMNGTLGELHAALGQTVADNAILVELNCTEAQARARVADAELTMARQNLDAKRNLRKLDAVGDLEVAMANTEVRKTEGARALAQAQASYC